MKRGPGLVLLILAVLAGGAALLLWDGESVPEAIPDSDRQMPNINPQPPSDRPDLWEDTAQKPR